MDDLYYNLKIVYYYNLVYGAGRWQFLANFLMT